MRAIVMPAAGAALLFAACASSPSSQMNGEKDLAGAVAGRMAGKPHDCINLRDIKSSSVVDGLAIVYTMTDGTLEVNRPASGASSLRTNTILVSDTHSGQLCNIDIIRLQDNTAQADIGSVALGKFVPYPR